MQQLAEDGLYYLTSAPGSWQRKRAAARIHAHRPFQYVVPALVGGVSYVAKKYANSGDPPSPPTTPAKRPKPSGDESAAALSSRASVKQIPGNERLTATGSMKRRRRGNIKYTRRRRGPLKPRKFTKKRVRFATKYARSVIRRRRSRPRRVNKFATQGSIYLNETTALVSSSTNATAVIGHGTACSQIMRSMARAILRKLFAGAGEQIEDWSKYPRGPQNARVIKYWYTTNNTPAQYTERFFGPITTDVAAAGVPATAGARTYFVLANDLADDMWTILLAGDANVQFYQFEMSDWNGGAQSQVCSSIDASRMTFEFNVNSKLTVQNTSVATGGDTANANAVSDNPVLGKKYTRNKNHFPLETMTYRAITTPQSIVADKDTGVISAGTNSTGALAGLPEYFRRPPSKTAMQALTCTDVYFRAGQIKQFSFNHKFSYTMNTMVKKFQQMLSVDSTFAMDFGKSEVLVLRKQLSTSAESNMTFEMKVEQKYSCLLKNTRAYAPMIIALDH